MNQVMEAALNDQVREEYSSAYSYLAMSAYCEANQFPGAAHWLRLQAREETEHALKIFEFIHDRGGRVRLQAIPQPQTDWASLEDVFENVLRQEQRVTEQINSLYALATRENDYASIPLLQWFITEQTEEEKGAEDVLNMVKASGGHRHTLLFVDKELGKRS